MQLDNIEERDLKMGLANQVVFAKTLEELAANDKAILVVTSDSRGSGKLVPFAEKYPKQIVEVGIAEQNSSWFGLGRQEGICRISCLLFKRQGLGADKK